MLNCIYNNINILFFKNNNIFKNCNLYKIFIYKLYIYTKLLIINKYFIYLFKEYILYMILISIYILFIFYMYYIYIYRNIQSTKYIIINLNIYFMNFNKNINFLKKKLIFSIEGALTSKPYSFITRLWELHLIQSIDILDSIGSNIIIYVKENQVFRILPKVNSFINEEWITDKIRFIYDSFKHQRLFIPYVRTKYNKLIICSWELLYKYIKINFIYLKFFFKSLNRFYSFAGNIIDITTLISYKFFIKNLGIFKLNTNYFLFNDLRYTYLITKLINIEDYNLFILWGLNLKIEAPILNLKIKNIKNVKFITKHIFYIGNFIYSNYKSIHLGICLKNILNFFYGKSFLCLYIILEISIFTLYGKGFYNNFSLILENQFKNFLKNKFFSFNFLNWFSSELLFYDLDISASANFYNYFTKKYFPKFIYLLNVDLFMYLKKKNYNFFLIYHGHHGSFGIQYANIIIPSNIFIEYENYFLNCESKIQYSSKILSSSIYNFNIILNSLYKVLQKNFKICKLQNYFYFIKNLWVFVTYPFILILNKNFSLLFTKELLNNFIQIKKYSFIIEYIYSIVKLYFEMDIFCKTSINIQKQLFLIKNMLNTNFNINN